MTPGLTSRSRQPFGEEDHGLAIQLGTARFHSRMTSKFVVPSPNWPTHPCVQQPYIAPSHRWPEDILNFALAKNSARNVAFGVKPGPCGVSAPRPPRRRKQNSKGHTMMSLWYQSQNSAFKRIDAS